MPLEIVRHDITKMNVDAVVNATNSQLKRGGGVSGAIFTAAGLERLEAACDRIGYCAPGKAVLTAGYGLLAKYIIHTVGPIWEGGRKNEDELLSSSYTSSLHLALEHGLNSVAFPLISSGIYDFPKDRALRIAISAIGSFLLKHELVVYLVVFDKMAYRLSDRLFKSIKTYIDDNYVEEQVRPRLQSQAELAMQLREAAVYEAAEPKDPARDLADVVSQVGETFTEMLLRLIDESGKSDPQVYKQANMDRRLFSKIRSNAHYQPSKNTALALAVALELNLDQTADLLRRAGFALSPSNRFDLVVQYFIGRGNHNIFEINEALFAFDESLLGA